MEFQIIEDNEFYVVIGEGFKQDIDFENGGKITSLERAEQVKMLLIQHIEESKNAAILPTAEEEIEQLRSKQFELEQTLDAILTEVLPALMG